MRGQLLKISFSPGAALSLGGAAPNIEPGGPGGRTPNGAHDKYCKHRSRIRCLSGAIFFPSTVLETGLRHYTKEAISQANALSFAKYNICMAAQLSCRRTNVSDLLAHTCFRGNVTAEPRPTLRLERDLFMYVHVCREEYSRASVLKQNEF